MGEVSTFMTINGPAPILLAFYIACAERQGVDPAVIRERSRTTSSSRPSTPGWFRPSPRSG